MCIFLSHQTFPVSASFWQLSVTSTGLQKVQSSVNDNPSQNAQIFQEIVEMKTSIWLYVSEYNQSACYRVRLIR